MVGLNWFGPSSNQSCLDLIFTTKSIKLSFRRSPLYVLIQFNCETLVIASPQTINAKVLIHMKTYHSKKKKKNCYLYLKMHILSFD